MAFSKTTSSAGKYVCADCIGDFVVKAEIEAAGRRRRCSYCKEMGRAVAIEQVADRVDDIYGAMVGEAELTPHFPNDSDRVEYRQDGSTPSAIVTEMLECAYDDIAEDVVGELSERHSYYAMKDGDTDRYDDSSDIFEIAIPRSAEIRESWRYFCDSVRHGRRYFNAEAAELLKEILDPIVDPQTPGTRSAVRLIEPGSDEGFLYRGRMANSVATRATVLAKPISELGASPKELNASGRMNAAGIPVFYGSFDVATCVAELRGPVGGTAVVGKFAVLRPVRVLDLMLLKNAMFNISYFDDDVVRKFAYNRFLRGFHNEIKKPVIPGSETLDYLPTQFVAEYLWTKVDPPLDGLIYGSAQISEASARNIALFPHATEVEGWLEERYPAKTLVEPPASVETFAELFADPVARVEPSAPVEAPGAAALRLMLEDIVIADVQAIKYSLHERSVGMYDAKMRYSDPDDDRDDDDG